MPAEVASAMAAEALGQGVAGTIIEVVMLLVVGVALVRRRRTELGVQVADKVLAVEAMAITRSEEAETIHRGSPVVRHAWGLVIRMLTGEV
jgi:hypothetical protein